MFPDHAELGDQFAEFAGVNAGQWDVAGAEGRAGTDAQLAAGEIHESAALRGHGGEAFETVAAFAVEDELGGQMTGTIIADKARLGDGRRGALVFG